MNFGSDGGTALEGRRRAVRLLEQGNGWIGR